MKAPKELGKMIEFEIGFEKIPEKETDLSVYMYNPEGKLLGSAQVKKGRASLPLEIAQAKDARLFISPTIAGKRKPKLDDLRKADAFEPKYVFDPRTPLQVLQPIPIAFPDLWILCRCVVKGKVAKPAIVNGNLVFHPVCGAKVHICEVDKLWLLIPRLPIDVIFHMRDELIKDWKKHRLLPKPPVIKFPWPPLPPDPYRIFPVQYPEAEIMEERVTPINLPSIKEEGNWLAAQPAGYPYHPSMFNPQPEPPAPEYITPRMSQQMRSAKMAMTSARSRKETKLPLLIDTIPAKVAADLESASDAVVRGALREVYPMILPYICFWPWLHPYICACDELATVISDYGDFETTIWYRCAGDKPDLYFWVEYQIDGVWTTVYNPKPLCCHVHWNYPCGEEVLLPVTDPRVPWCAPNPDLPELKVLVKTIGNGLSMSEIDKTSGATMGKTTAGEPLASSLELRLDMSRSNLIDLGVTHYRWSYRRKTKGDGVTTVTDSWHVMTHEVHRPYVVKVFEPYPVPHFIDKTLYEKMGPFTANMLFKIQPKNPTFGVWYDSVMNEHVDLTWAYFDTEMLKESDGVTPAAGQYETKLELFDGSGNLIKWNNPGGTGENIQAYVTSNPAPFEPPTGMSITPAPAANLIKNTSGDTLGYIMTLYVDNNRCEASIDDPFITTTPDALAGPCGFLFFDPTTAAKTRLRFLAKQKFDHGVFSFWTVKGSSGYIPDATLGWDFVANAQKCVPVNNTALVTYPVNGFARAADSHFSKDILVTDLLNANGSICPQAAFACTLGVYSTAYNGYTQAWWLDAWAVPKAFALTPETP
ncbi:MAG TPA: hypothetical protein PKW57_08640 [Anaerolineaceae bacterium]|nr:hypothetical protein [Anaerolineaceae bacterium]